MTFSCRYIGHIRTRGMMHWWCSISFDNGQPHLVYNLLFVAQVVPHQFLSSPVEYSINTEPPPVLTRKSRTYRNDDHYSERTLVNTGPHLHQTRENNVIRMTKESEKIGKERHEFVFMVLKSTQASFNQRQKCRKPIKNAPRSIICQWVRWNSLDGGVFRLNLANRKLIRKYLSHSTQTKEIVPWRYS